MSIIIPGKMPKQKSIFIEITPNGVVNEIINPLLSVSIGLATELRPHGDLIDRSKIIYTRDDSGLRSMAYVRRAQLENVTPVIPAELERRSQ